MDYDSELVFPRDKTGRDSEVRNMFRAGKVVEQITNETGVFVRVQYLDKDGLISQPIPVNQSAASQTKKMICPKVGSDVNILMLPNGDEDGFVIGSFYNTGNPPPTDNPNLDITRYNDGTIIEYDENSSTYNIDAKGLVNIKTATDVVVNGVNIRVSGSGEITLTAANIVLEGEMLFKGNIRIEGDIEHIGDNNQSGTHRDQGMSVRHQD